MTGLIEAHLNGQRTTPEDAQARAATRTYGTPDATAPGSVALINLHGPILTRGGAMTMSGYTSPQAFAQQVRAAADNPDIQRIVISVDSPGGTVSGTRDAAAAVAYARTRKDTVAVADELAASAAYWIAAQATTVVAAPGATLGSIGVIMSLKDTSAAEQNAGVTTHVLRSGDHKALGQPGEAITDTTLAQYHEQLMVHHADFVTAVAQGRGLTPAQAEALATGRTWIGADAVYNHLADHVGTLQQALHGEFSALNRTPTAARRSSPAHTAETTQGGDPMDPRLLALLGVAADATPDQIEAAIHQRAQASADATRADLLAHLGLTADTSSPEHLQALATQAADGRAYRDAQLDRLHALTITIHGNDPAGVQAADDARAVYATQPLDRITAHVARLEAQRDTLPAGPRARRDDPKTPTIRPNLSAFGLNTRR